MSFPFTSSMNETENYENISAIALFATLICICIVVGHFLERFKWVNESVTAISIGLLTGLSVLIFKKGKSSTLLQFDENLFFVYLLPPIIFNAGFQVKKKSFFRNFFAIMVYGILGIFISFGIISSGLWLSYGMIGLELLTIKDLLTLGTIFSATDSVCTLQILDQDKHALLYSLVFGEGVVNDATSVALFRAVQNFSYVSFSFMTVFKFFFNFFYLFLFSTVLGVSVGLLSAFIINHLYLEDSTDREVALMIVMAYLSYVLSELLGLSGILTIFFCGVVMSHYTWHNVTESSRVTSKHSFASMSFISEIFIFIYVGMDCFDLENWKRTLFKEGFVLFFILLFLTLLGRIAFVFPLSYFINKKRKTSKRISFNEQIIIWWSGLMRGAVSIALTFNAFSDFDHNSDYPTIISSTISFVLFSTIVFGLLTRPLIDFLLPENKDSKIFNRIDSLISEPDNSIPDLLRIPLLDPKNTSQLPTQTDKFPNQTIPEPHFPQPFSSTALTSQTEPQLTPNLDPKPNFPRLNISEPQLSQTASFQNTEPSPLPAVSEPNLLENEPTFPDSYQSFESNPARMRRIQSLVRDAGIQVILNAEEKDIHQLWRWFDKSYMRPYFGGKAIMDETRQTSQAIENMKSNFSNFKNDPPSFKNDKTSKSRNLGKRASDFKMKQVQNMSEIMECEDEGGDCGGLADGERAFPENISEFNSKEKEVERKFFGLANSEPAWPSKGRISENADWFDGDNRL